MKRLSKILVLVLSVALLCGVIFTLAASAETEAPKYWYNGETGEMVGATRIHRDFTNETFDMHASAESGVAAKPSAAQIPNDLWVSGTGKYGQTRTITTPTGNTYLEFAFRMDDAGSTSGADNITGVHPKTQLYANDYSYIVYEFDMATPTNFPGNMSLAIEMRPFNGSSEYSHGGKQVRPKTNIGTYSSASGTWSFGGKTLELARGEWAHVTLVMQVNSVKNPETGLVNYGSSVIKLYINGEYYCTVNGFISNIETAESIKWRIHYVGLGWVYGAKHTGSKADDAVAMDNFTLTTFDKNYAVDTDNANLPALFAKNAPTTLKDLGPEVVWIPKYALPEDIGCAIVVDEDGEEYASNKGVFDVQSAIAFIKQEGLEGATVKLLANQYNPVLIDFETALKFDTNGYALQNGFEVPSQYMVSYDAQTQEIVVEEDLSKLLTLKYFTAPRGMADKEVLVTKIAEGRDIVIGASGFTLSPLAYGKTGYVPTGNFIVYDEEGNVITTPDATVAPEHTGKTWYVYPEFTTETKTNNIVFVTLLNGKYTFYDTSDLWAAGVQAEPTLSEVTTTTAQDGTVTKTWTSTQTPKGIPNGTTIILLADATLSAPLRTLENDGGTFTLDLNGYKLTLASTLLTTSAKTITTPYTQVGDKAATAGKTEDTTYPIKNNKVFVHSSKAGAEIFTNNNLLNGDNGDGKTNGSLYYLGYQNATTLSANRITMSFKYRIVAFVKGAFQSLYMANIDLYNSNYVDGLICAQQSRDVNFYFDNCNVYTNSPLFGSNANSGAKNVTMSNTNVYATGGVPMNWITTQPAKDGSLPNGDTKLVMNSSNIYGMTFGQTAGDGLAAYTATFSITMDANSTISDTHANITTPSGSVLVRNPKTVTINGTTYTTIYTIGSGSEDTAKFDIYGVAFEDYTAETKPIDSWDIVAGGWFASWAIPEGEIFYDMNKDLYHTSSPVRYTVFDENGNPVQNGKAVAGQTYKAFVEYDKVAVAFTIISKDGTVTPYTDKQDYDKYTFQEGDTFILVSGDYAMKAVAQSIKIDLNGNTLYQTGKTNSFTGATGARFFLYSSKEGGRFIQGFTSESSCAYFFNSKANDVQMYVGYVDENTKSPYRIEMFTGAFAEIQSANNHLYLNNVDVYKVFGDNYGFFNFRANVDASSYNAENCNFYGTFGVYLRQTANTDPDRVVGTLNMKNCNVFAGALVGTANAPQVGTLVFNLEDVGFYGGAKEGAISNTMRVKINVKGNYVTNFVPALTTFGDRVLAPKTSTVTTAGTNVPNAGYGKNETFGYANTYTAAYTLVSKEEFKAMAYQNMTLDTNVVTNLYLPTSMEKLIKSITCDGTNLLDKEALLTIGGVDYYVITMETAPKYGDKAAKLVVNFYNGQSVEFTMSVANYAQALFALDGKDNQYIADSQTMMKYVLTYIKEVAVKFGGADESTIFRGIDYKIETKTEIKELAQDTSAINTYVTHAALNLDAYAGFAFKVAAGFTGTIRVEMKGVDAIEKTYSAEAPAGENEVIVLENVPAYLFRGDVTITVTPAEGDVVSAAFNLATYMKENSEAYTMALYAYSVVAEDYNTKYPTVKTVD